jgi:hypothetical protein
MTVNAETLRQNNVQELVSLKDDRAPYPLLHCGCAPAHNVASLLFPANIMGLCRRGTTKKREPQSLLIEQSLKDYEVLNGYLVAGDQKKVDEANAWS